MRKTVITFRPLARILIALLIVLCAALCIGGGEYGAPNDGADAVMAMELDAEPELQAPAEGNDPETHAASWLSGPMTVKASGAWQSAGAGHVAGQPPDPWRPPPRA